MQSLFFHTDKIKQFIIVTMVVFFGISQLAIANISPQELEGRVYDALGSYYLQDFDITANSEGNVTIEGQVNTLNDKYRVFEIISGVKGVKAISNQLTINTPMLPDNVIKNNIANELNMVSAIVEPERIDVKVDNGIVFLNGKVSYYREKIFAKTVASWHEGVKGIVNKIEVLPTKKARSDENLERVLQGIMDNRFSIEKNVTFTIDNGVVTLTGKATTLWAKDKIEEAFANVMGIKSVDNNLTVEEWPSL
jgi:osmotically-inducible protein OsmY